MDLAPHLVVVSDVHLGLPEHAYRSVRFAQWVDRLAQRRFEGRPWRLILAGDIFEFLHLPPAGGEAAWRQPPNERAAVEKFLALKPVLAPALGALGRFVAAGHQVHFTVGNHDRELILRPVRRLLVKAMFELGKVPARLRRQLASHVVVHPWFYCEPGRVHVEHGHQFDEFSSYTDVLLAHPEDAPHLEEPISHMAVRLFLYETRGLMKPEDGEKWGFFQFVRWGVQIGARRALGFLVSYVVMVAHLLVAAVRMARHPLEPTGKAVRALRGHAQRYRLEVAKLVRMRRHWHRPASPIEVLQCFFADRLILIAGAMLLAVWIVAGFGASVESAVAVPSVGVATAGAWMALERRRSVDQHPRLVKAAARLNETLGVPFVVFGHSHTAARQRIEGGKGWYLNPGGWADAAETEPASVVLRRTAGGDLELLS